MDKIVAIPFALTLGGIVSLILAWPVMVLIGNASIASGGVIPSLGYWTTFWISWAVLLLTSGSWSN